MTHRPFFICVELAWRVLSPAMFLLSTIFAFLTACVGRWIQMNPGKFVLQGTYESPDAPAAISFRKMVSALGTFFVFFGTYGAVISLFFWTQNPLVLLPVHVAGIALAIFVSIRVRREVREKAKYIPGAYGLWP